MKLKIQFDEIKEAIEEASYERHYIIDKKNHKIILISEYEDNYENMLKEVEGSDFIAFEPRTPQDDLRIMQSFVYEVRDFILAQKLDKALNKRRPFANFREFINQHPEMNEKWLRHMAKEIENRAINWLYENDIELENQSFMPKIGVQELNSDDVEMPEGFEHFGPVECMNCGNTEGLTTRYFELSTPINNLFTEKAINKIMTEDFGIESYGYMDVGEKEILTSSECPKCKSRDLFEDL